MVSIGLQANSPFTLTGLPNLPLTLAPNASVSFTIVFSPSATGQNSAALLINSQAFTLVGSGTASNLVYTYTTGAGVLTAPVNGAVIFSPVQIGQTSSSVFFIQNTGTAAASVISISLQQANNPFTLTGLPNLPLTLAPNASVSFTIVFSPSATGQNTATLFINAQTFTLSGAGNAPPALPSFQFVVASGAEQALQQPSIGLTLSSPYPLPITGTLTLIEVPDGFSADPSVQFSTGGQMVAFTIPSNALQAIFSNGATTVKLQTGSVSGTITITPAFATAGGFNLTPNNPPVVSLKVPASAPQLLNVQIAATSATGITLQLTGVTTSRQLSSLNFVFTASSGFNLTSTQVSVDITTVSAIWFQSSQSTASGGQFTISVPFTLTSSSTSVTTPVTAVQSVATTISNSLGTSNSITTQIH